MSDIIRINRASHFYQIQWEIEEIRVARQGELIYNIAQNQVIKCPDNNRAGQVDLIVKVLDLSNDISNITFKEAKRGN